MEQDMLCKVTDKRKRKFSTLEFVGADKVLSQFGFIRKLFMHKNYWLLIIFSDSFP